MVIVLDHERVLMMWRHHFVVDRWVWELPGGYLDPAEDSMTCAARDVEEETGWRPRSMEKLISFQPMVGTIDQENVVYLARGADFTGAPPDLNEAERIGWLPLDEIQQHIIGRAISVLETEGYVWAVQGRGITVRYGTMRPRRPRGDLVKRNGHATAAMVCAVVSNHASLGSGASEVAAVAGVAAPATRAPMDRCDGTPKVEGAAAPARVREHGSGGR